MVDLYFTARELATMALPGCAATEQNINARARSENWPYIDRQGRGGGRMYPISVFKEAEIRQRILEHRTGSSAPVGLYVPQLDDRAKALRTQELRGDAVLIICRRFKEFAAHHRLKLTQAEPRFFDQFCHERDTRQFTWFADWIVDLVPTFSIQSLRRWRGDVAAAAPGEKNRLFKKYGNRKGKSLLAMAESGEVENTIAALLHQKPHIRAGHVRDYIRAQFGETLKVTDASGAQRVIDLPGIRTFERFLIQWKKDNASTFLKISDPDGWKNKYMVAVGNASAQIHRLNQRWEIDASPADMLLEDGRYSIYAIIDVWSRRVLFSVSRTACTDASLMLVRRAIMEWGVPEVLKTDNGSDFTSHRFIAAINSLDIRLETCIAFTPEQKPHVERVIKTMQHDLIEILPGYVGHSVADRKKIEARKAFAQRLGESDKAAFAVEMDHVKLQEYMDSWALQKYAHRKHSSLGATPFAKAASWDMPIRRIENVRALDLLLAPLAGTDGFRTVGKKGLHIDNGIFYGGNLELYVGQRVLVRHDPEDMGRVYAFTEDGAFICEAINHDRLGADPTQAASEARARQKKFVAEETKELRRKARQITPEKVAESILSISARESAKIAQFPQRADLHAPDQLIEAARAYDTTPLVREKSAEEKAAHQAFVTSFEEYQKQSAAQPESDEDRWWERRRYLRYRIAMNETLSEGEADWLKRAEESPWCKARMDFEALQRKAMGFHEGDDDGEE